MTKEELEQIKKYLLLKEIEEEDKSDEMIEEIYQKVLKNKEDKNEQEDNRNK